MTSCMKGQGMHIEFKDNYNKKGMLHNSIPQEEETSTLAVDSKEEDEEEAWVEVEAILFSITMPIHDIWKGIFRTLVLLETTITHLIMLLKNLQFCSLNFRRN